MAYQNFFATKLATEIGASDTTIQLETAPSVTSGRLVLEARNPTQREIIKFTGVSGTSITGVSRGQGGTTAKTHLRNALVEMNLTGEDLQETLSMPDNLAQAMRDTSGDFIVPGTGLITQSSGLTGAFSDVQYYINGVRYTKASIANKTYTASRDTYVFIDTAGTVIYTDVANNATAPATPASSVLVAVVVTNASGITGVTQRNVGGTKREDIDWATIGAEPFIVQGSATNVATSGIAIQLPTNLAAVEVLIQGSVSNLTAGNVMLDVLYSNVTNTPISFLEFQNSTTPVMSDASHSFVAELKMGQYNRFNVKMECISGLGTHTQASGARMWREMWSEKATVLTDGLITIRPKNATNNLSWLIKCYKKA